MHPRTSDNHPPKTFSSMMERGSSRFESYEEQRTKRPLVHRDSAHERDHKTLQACGNWAERVLVTLTVLFEVYDPLWFLRAWRRTLRRYYELRPEETVKYNITANRGESGRERASAHVIFDEDGFPDLDVLERCWEAEIRGNFVVTSGGGRASLYQSKNATEPEAVEEQWNLKLSKEELRGNGVQRAPRKPSRPSPASPDAAAVLGPQERWKADLKRRRAQSARRRAARKERRQAEEDDWLAQNHRAVARPRPIGTNTDAAQSAIGALALGRQTMVGLVQEEFEVREWRCGLWPNRRFLHIFRDDQGRRYRWYGTNPAPINVRGYQHRGRYPVLPGVPLTFNSTVTDIWSNETIIISNSYIRLDRQSEETKRAYALAFDISFDELGLDGDQ